ncbi:CU044_5270 family protein [Streptomyces fuscigenes]|uniref:CU044_5270 family protein n=1 Tax=Streptomyces fuscigenes TaxID=1528880 RepID=UPI001F342A29|nr:CU044_5270 family protein [Streptomyces fuscigenes]MCF3963727.1 CU044_5270 family protein [Streptomyces fuscigenes]
MTFPTGSGPDRAEREALERLLPPPAEQDLPEGRHLHHKERLMNLIDSDREQGNGRSLPTPSPVRRRVLRAAVVMPVAALAVAAALTGTLLATGDHGNAAAAGPGAASAGAGPAGGADVLLGRIAQVASARDIPRVRDDQLVYVKTLGAGASRQSDGTFVMEPVAQREEWVSQKPGRVVRLGMTYEHGEYMPWSEFVPAGDKHPGLPEGILRPTYSWLASLPTDPDALLARLYRITPKDSDDRTKGDRDQAVFQEVGYLLRDTVMPAPNAAALYRAAAKIPGVTLTRDARDVSGRHGIAITRVDERASTASEWIFDKHSLAYLGDRSYLTADSAAGKKGAIMDEYAVLASGVVDAYKQRP